jgi:beta-lactamase regulating signal transducer with metallopeptidase domain
MILLLVESALRAMALAIAAWVVLRVFRVRNVPAQKCAWTVVLASAFIMPLLLLAPLEWRTWPGATLRIPMLSSPRPSSPAHVANYSSAAPHQAQIQAHSAPAPSADLSPASVQLPRFPAPVVSPDYANAGSRQANDRSSLSLAGLVWPVYLAIAGMLLLRFINGIFAVVFLWRRAEPVSPAVANLAPGIELRTSHLLSSPVNIWAGIVLPLDYTTWDEKKLRIVLAHERSHVRQRDFYLQLFAGLYQSLVWFSPLGWWLKFKLSDLGEAISDRAGLVEAASRFSYAQVLFEFAASPRAPLIGVAMARPSSLARRVDRLLNESAFQQAFTGGRRVLLAALLAPVVLFAASALVRVEAAPVQTASPATGQSHPDAAPILASSDAQPKPQIQSQPVPLTAPQPDVAPSTSDGVGTSSSADASSTNSVTTTNSSDGRHYSYSNDYYAYSSSDDGDAYALVLNNDDKIAFSGDWNDSQREEIERARKSAGAGSFLWFRHGGKSYIITDAATIQQIAGMYKPIQELGKQQEALGLQQEALGKQQEALGHAQENVKLDGPEFNEQMAKLKTNLAALQEQINKQVTEVTMEELQSRLAEVESRIGEIQGQIGAKQGVLGEQQGKLGEEQGRLGEEQGRLGEQQGKIARQVDEKVKSIIDQSLKDGKAQPEK